MTSTSQFWNEALKREKKTEEPTYLKMLKGEEEESQSVPEYVQNLQSNTEEPTTPTEVSDEAREWATADGGSPESLAKLRNETLFSALGKQVRGIKKFMVETHEQHETAFNQVVDSVKGISESLMQRNKFNPASPTFMEALSESFPESITSNLVRIIDEGPQSEQDVKELEAAFAWGKLEHEGVTPELRAEAVIAADARAKNLARVESLKKSKYFQDSFLWTNFHNEDGSLNQEKILHSSLYSIISFS